MSEQTRLLAVATLTPTGEKNSIRQKLGADYARITYLVNVYHKVTGGELLWKLADSPDDDEAQYTYRPELPIFYPQLGETRFVPIEDFFVTSFEDRRGFVIRSNKTIESKSEFRVELTLFSAELCVGQDESSDSTPIALATLNQFIRDTGCAATRSWRWNWTATFSVISDDQHSVCTDDRDHYGKAICSGADKSDTFIFGAEDNA